MKKLLLISYFIFTAYFIFSQQDLKFKRYTKKDGLVSNYVYCIAQDAKGFMWFGTKNGVSRFDGYEFKNYQGDESPGSFAKGWTRSIVSDKKGRLWFGSMTTGSKSLVEYNYEKDIFIDYEPALINENTDVKSLFCDKDGIMWIGTCYHGVFVLHPDSFTFTQYIGSNNEGNDLLEGEVNCFTEDEIDNIWIGTTAGLNKFNKNTKALSRCVHDPKDPSSLSNPIVETLYIDDIADMWIGIKDGGVNRLKSEAYRNNDIKFERIMHTPGDDSGLSHNTVFSIGQDKKGDLLIATLYGLNILDRKTNNCKTYYNIEENPETINSNLIKDIFHDKTGNIWLATGMGVARMLSAKFKSYIHSPFKKNISHNKVEMLHQDKTGKVWIATPKGFDVYDPTIESFNFALECGDKYPCWFTSNIDKCWLISREAKLLNYNCTSREITPFQHDKVEQLALDINDFLNVHVDISGNTWIGKRTGGMYYFSNDKKTFYRFKHDNEDSLSLSSNNILAIFEDNMGDIWIGTGSGLNKVINIEKGIFKRYLNFFGDYSRPVSISCIAESKEQTLWLGSSLGIIHLDMNNGKSIVYGKDLGFPSTLIFGIIEDNSQNLWISSNTGLIKYTPDYNNLNALGKLRIYTVEDGLSSEEFNHNAFLKLSDGSLIFGGKGFIHFHPDSINENKYAPQVEFTGLYISGKHVGIGDTINNQVILYKSLSETDEIVLNYKNLEFSIDFAALHFNAANKNQYAYKLEGYHTDWQYRDATNRQANFMNLEIGGYTLKVLAANSDGVWTQKAKQLKIHVLPPWWLTLWFKIFAGAIFALIIILLIRFRTYKLRKQKQKLEKIVKQRTAELRGKNLELEEGKEELEQQAKEMEQKSIEIERIAKQLHAADQSKLRFFANISHEFRTPLALIIGPLEKFSILNQPILWDNINLSNYHKLMHKNAKKLLRLVNEIIDLRKLDQGKKSLNLSQNNIVDFLQDIVKLFTVMAETKNIHLTLDIEHLSFNKNQPQPQHHPDNLVETKKTSKNEDQMINDKCNMINDFWFDPEIMEKIFYNLISNAIKYTNEGGEIIITIDVTVVETHGRASLQNRQLAIKISDTGIGIEPENLDKIFDRFYRVKTRLIASQPEGAGIGLAYTKELVELHNGSISVDSILDKGTCFTLQFPCSNSNQSSHKKDESKNDQANYKLDYINTRIKEEQSSGIYNQSIIDNHLSPSGELHGSDMSKEHVSIKGTVLIIEDTHDMRNFLREELQSAYSVITAKDGLDGLETAYQFMPDIIVSDIMMPGISGIQLCKKLKTDEATSHIPIILLTAKTGEENAIMGLETGADDYITKPFSLDILKLKIHNILESRKKLQEHFGKSIKVIPEEYSKNSADQKFLAKAIQIVEENLLEPEFNNDKFISLLGHGKTMVYKKIKSITNQSVSDFIRSIRLKKAAQMLLEGENNISQICFTVGFPNPSSFSRHFKAMFNKTPSQFIKDNKNFTI